MSSNDDIIKHANHNVSFSNVLAIILRLGSLAVASHHWSSVGSGRTVWWSNWTGHVIHVPFSKFSTTWRAGDVDPSRSSTASCSTSHRAPKIAVRPCFPGTQQICVIRSDQGLDRSCPILSWPIPIAHRSSCILIGQQHHPQFNPSFCNHTTNGASKNSSNGCWKAIDGTGPPLA